MRAIRQMSLEGTSPSMTRALGRSLPTASRISPSVVAAAGEQPDPAVLLADDQAIPVMLDLVNPVGSDPTHQIQHDRYRLIVPDRKKTPPKSHYTSISYALFFFKK